MRPLLDDIMERCRVRGDDDIVRDIGRDGALALTGAAFAARAHDLSAHLRDLGVGAGWRVGLRLPPSVDFLIAAIAVWMADASFVPLDPEEAPVRRQQILADSGIALVLGREAEVSLDGDEPACATLADGRLVSLRGRPRCRPLRRSWDDEAYVIFTSGSTGRPKGVSVGHRALAYYVRQAQRTYDIPRAGMIFPFQLPPTFDAAITSIVPPLVTGNVVCPIQDALSATRGLAACLRGTTSRVLVKTTPSQLRLLADLLTADDVSRLSGVFVVGGEQLDYADIRWLRGNARLSIFNEYGPTEATVGCCIYRVAPSDPSSGPVPIGTPFDGTHFALERNDDEADFPSAGDLVICGPSIANGYVNVDDTPFGQVRGGRTYATGDRVRLDDEGCYHFLGRRDDQIKVDGFRIELSEVEAALRRATAGRPSAAVIAGGTLVGIIAGSADLDVATIAAGLGQQLPPYMRPSEIRAIASLPLTAHGKIDRARLLAWLNESTSAATAAPSPREPAIAAPGVTTTVATVWETLLGIERVTSETDFFAAGGHSVTALKMSGRLSRLLGQDVPLSIVFDHPTLEAFVAALQQLVARGEPRALAAPQLAILSAETLSIGDGAFTVVDAVRVTGVPDWNRFHDAMEETLQRHDVFSWRCRLDEANRPAAQGGPTGASGLRPTESIDLRGFPAAVAEEAIVARLSEERRRRIDLLDDTPCTRALLFRTGRGAGEGGGDGERGVGALVTHHALVDEESTHLIWREVVERTMGRDAPASYDARYREWAARSVSALARPRALRLAHEIADRLIEGRLGAWSYRVGRAHQQDSADAADASWRFLIPPALATRVRATSRRLSLPVSACYGAAVVRALAPSMTARRFAVFMPMTQRRTEADFETVGCFVTALPILVEQPVATETATTAIKRWHRSVAFTVTRADADPGEIDARLTAALPWWSGAPTCSLAFEAPQAGTIDRMTWTALPPPDGPAKYDLTIAFSLPADGRPQDGGRLIWRHGILDADTAPQLAQAILDAVASLCDGDQLPSVVVAEKPARGGDDRIPRPTTRVAPSPAVGDCTAMARDLASIITTVMQRDLGTEDNLFEAGMRSLDLLRVITAIRRRYAVRLRAVDLFDCPTTTQLAALVLARGSEDLSTKDMQDDSVNFESA